MTPTEFEHALAFLCERDGCSNVQVVGGASDLGADVIATTPTGVRLVIQAKRNSPTNLVKGPDL
jgi:restriction system protein